MPKPAKRKRPQPEKRSDSSRANSVKANPEEFGSPKPPLDPRVAAIVSGIKNPGIKNPGIKNPGIKNPSSGRGKAASGEIPEAVSRRMVKRVMIFSGIPSLLGVSSFFVNYYLIKNTTLEIPTVFTLVETLVLFGLGFVGISYGVLSSSWEDTPGSWLGLGEFRRNLGNFWQERRQHKASKPAKADSKPSK